jgi:hypothetical protein
MGRFDQSGGLVSLSMESFIMNDYIVGQELGMGQESPRGRTFVMAMLSTLGIGVVLAGLAIFHFRAPDAPPPVVIDHPPEVRVVEKPAPPPQVIIKEVPIPAPSLPPPPLPQPTVTTVWGGVWRTNEYPLPMFRINQSGALVDGTYAPPNWGSPLSFRNGLVIGDTLEFVVEDQVFRAHFRMSMVGDSKAKVEEWVSDEDWMTSLERANKAARTPQQALQARAILEENAKRLRKPVTVGIFGRQASGG